MPNNQNEKSLVDFEPVQFVSCREATDQQLYGPKGKPENEEIKFSDEELRAAVEKLPKDENIIDEVSEILTERINRPTVYILHHSDCDGYAAGAIAFNCLSDRKKDLKAIPVNYGQPFPELKLKLVDEVYILDFSYKRAILDDINTKVKKLVVLDHHTTAEEELRGAPYAHFDMTKSGVLLAWEHFVPEYPATEVVMLLDSYDLWKKEEPLYPWKMVMMFHFACESMLKDFSFWTALMNGYYIDPGLWKIGKEYHEKFSESVDAIKSSALTEVAVINEKRIGFFFANDYISLLCDEMYSDKNLNLDAVICCTNNKDNIWSFSLRAPSKTEFFVHEIAKAFDGGGHKKAAGFKMNIEIEPGDVVEMLIGKLKELKF